jgi:alpha-amylase/alpha-mannosidase (GH57 family)
MDKTALVVHGHFYQPPRENPWTGNIEPQPSARPFDDWNERIHSECYRPNAHARIIDTYGRVERVVNNYSHLSFNFGPTLLVWLARHHPNTYARVIEADRRSARLRSGHGNAFAQGYHHAILPLCDERDRRTEIRWGVADFRRRFGREPESLWLPETACDSKTLASLIEEGLRYVVLSPHQAERVRPIGADAWQTVADGQVDTSLAYGYAHPDGSGRSIAVFFYDGHVAKAIAFDGALASSHMLVERFERAAAGRGRLVNVATDGESYGHHFKFGDRGLAYALEVEAPRRGFRVTNYGEFLDENPPAWEVEIKAGPDGEGTAWSCAHGLGRWTRDCGCQAGAPEGWNQRWRGPLRAALNFLREEAAALFESQGGDLFADPWEARDHYVELLDGRGDGREPFLRAHAPRAATEEARVRALTLLELQRASLMMFTSCGWFFNDVSGIETVQVLKYAARVLDLFWELGARPPRDPFLGLLAEAESNVAQRGTGADIFAGEIEPSRVTPRRLAASLAISGLVAERDESGEAAGYRFERTGFERRHHGRLTLSTERLQLEWRATGRRFDFAAASVYFGDADFYCAVRDYAGDDEYARAAKHLWDEFPTASLPALLRHTRDEFGPAEFGIEHLLPGGRRRVHEIVFGRMVNRFTEQYEYLYEENRRNIEMLQRSGFQLPEELSAAAEFTIARRFEAALERFEREHDAAAFREALEIAGRVARHGFRVDRTRTRARIEQLITRAVVAAVESPAPELFRSAFELIGLAQSLGLDADHERAQEIVYEALTHAEAEPSGELRELAHALRLAPALFETNETANRGRTIDALAGL